MVVIEIESVVKGKVNSKKTIVVKQFEGNCDQISEFGDQNLIVGDQLEKFVDRTPKRRKIKEGEIPPTSMLPPPPSVYFKTAIFRDSGDEEVSYCERTCKRTNHSEHFNAFLILCNQ